MVVKTHTMVIGILVFAFVLVVIAAGIEEAPTPEDYACWLKSNDPVAINYAAMYFCSVPNEIAVEPLITALENTSKWGSESGYAIEGIRDNVVGALKKNTNQDFGKDHEKWKEWYKQKNN